MKKFLSFLMVMVLAISMMVPFPIDLTFDFVLPASAETVTSGTTGDCTWSLDGTVLTISGNGAMEDYYYGSTLPWGTLVTEVIINEGVTSIGRYAFFDCSSLTLVTIPNSVTSIEGAAFHNCTGLTSVTIPNSVTSIGYSAFYNCTGLTSITIPDGVTSIEERAFSGCTGLTLMTIPDSVTSIGDAAFYNCTGLTSVTIPNSVTSIGYYVFCRCTSLTSVTIPDSVTSIEERAFSGCTGLTSVTIPDSVTSIGHSAFGYCDGLTSVTVGNGVTSIGDDAFYDCDGLISVHITDLAAWCRIDFANYSSNPLYYALKLYLNGELVTKLEIPDGVTSIGSFAFEGCTRLTSVTIPNSVSCIGEGAFDDCTGLTSVHITDLAAWCRIDFAEYSANPLCNAGNLYLNGSLVTKLSIPRGIEEVKAYAFCSCSSITSLTIPNYITGIGKSAFSGCDGLTSVTIPDSVTSIGSNAFYGCDSLTSVTIGNGVTSIEDYAFAYCYYLTSATIGNGVTNIGDSAFVYCRGLNSVTFPDSVASIGNYAFRDCINLNSVTIPYTVTFIGTNAFDATLMVHEDSAGHTYALNNDNYYKLTEHTPAGEDVIVPATCTAEGSISNHCTVCDKDYIVEVLPMAEHDLEEPVIVPATCTATGSETVHCTSCGQDFVTVLPLLEHVIENNVCTLCGCPDIQSEHPYGNDLDQTWTHTVEGATSISVTFSTETYVEDYVDYITLYDGEDNEINYYTGAELAGQTVTVPGDTVKIRLESDSSGNGYGFSVTAVTAELSEAPEEPEIPTYNGIELSTAGAIQLLRYIDHREGLTAEQADINGDGKVTVFDAVRFLQLLNTTEIK